MTINNKTIKMKRSKAQTLIERTANLIREYNAGDNPLRINRMVVFGSYANSDKRLLSDVDIALGWECRSG
jgi:predicted nucleotidyltransferase